MRSSGPRGRRPAAALVVALLAFAALATASAAQSGRKQRPLPDRSRLASALPPTVCQPAWPTNLTGIASYYSVVVQLQNCQSGDIPLSLDLGPYEGQGTSLAGAGGYAAAGTSVVWDDGAGTTSANPVTVIPKGDGQGTRIGALVGFTTVPYWDGKRGDSPGPYADQYDTDSQIDTQEMRGSWAVYLPSATFELDVQPPLPFPYVPQYVSDGSLPGTPGARFSGLTLIRYRPGGLQDPIFTTSSQASAYGASPPASSFVPGQCYDPVSIVNGASYGGTATASNWSYRGIDENGNTFQFSPAANNFGPFGGLTYPAVLLVNSFVDTQDGAINEIPLRDQNNSATSTTPHYVQIAVTNVAGVNCSGTGKTYPVPVAIGADLHGLDLASTQLPGAVLANSNLSGASLTQINVASASPPPNLSYANLSGTVAAPTPAIRANFTGAKLIGANLSDMNLDGAIFQNTNLLLTNFSGSSATPALDLGGAQYCHTTLPSGIVKNDDCAALLTAQAPWSNVSTGGCTPTTCVYVSLYDNTTRTLARGLDWCTSGAFANQPSPPNWIGPLETGQLGFGIPVGSQDTSIHCAITYANGAGGKIRVMADTAQSPVAVTVDSGTCFGATASCYPRSADGSEPVTVSTNTYVKDDAMFVDVIACEPAAAINDVCPNTAALPGA